MADDNSGVKFRTLKMSVRPVVSYTPGEDRFRDAKGRDVTEFMCDLSSLWRRERAAFEAMMLTANDVRLKRH